MALLSGMPLEAIPHLEQATAINGEIKYSQLQEGPWTYLGRAYYEAKKYPQARQALERAIAVNKDDSLARLYLGLTLTRQGSHENSRKEVLLALLKVTGVRWNDLGEPKRAMASLDMAGVRPQWVETAIPT